MRAIIDSEIRLTGLTSAQRAEIQRRLTFDNPAYAQAQSAGRRTWGIDRHVHAFRVEGADLIVPWGCRYWLSDIDPAGEVQDNGWMVPAEIDSSVELRDYQTKALHDLISAGGGVLIAPTGAGKTTIGIALAAAFELRTLVLVRNVTLAEQWIEAIRKQTGCEAGLLGAGKDDDGHQFTIGVVQSLVKHPEWGRGYGLLLVDECHAVPGAQVMRVLAAVNAKYRFGLTATPIRRDGMEGLLYSVLGPIAHQITEVGDAVLPVKVARIDFPLRGQFDGPTELFRLLAANEARNELIVASALKCSKRMPTVILCKQVAHCETLVSMMPGSVLVHGGLPKKVRVAAVEAMQTADIIVGTFSLLSEGIDIPRLSALIMGAPLSAGENGAATQLVQSIGRIQRPHGNKQFAYVLDIVDQCPMAWKMWGRRRGVYQQYGFKLGGIERMAA